MTYLTIGSFVLATISLSPHVRSAIIIGNTVHLIADGMQNKEAREFDCIKIVFLEKTLFPIGQRSFTSPASALQPFKTQLNGPTVANDYGKSG